MFKQSISVVFPAFNEQENIKKTLRSSVSFLKKNFSKYEIIVVDDGSQDKTAEIVLAYRKADRHVRLLQHKKNIGYGAAVWDGISAAKKKLVFFADSDGQFDIKELKLFVQKIEDHDAVLGYRRKRNDRFMRKLNALGWKAVCYLMLGLKVKDIDCAFKLFKRASLQKIKVKSIGATFSAELLYKLQKNKSNMIELPVNHFPRKAGRATGAKLSVIVKAFDEIWKLYAADKGLVGSRTKVALAISAILLLASRLFLLSGSADFFDSNQYFWRARIPEVLKAMATGHAPYHPLYNFFNVIFYKIGFHDVAIATSLTSAIFGTLSVIFLYLVLRKLFGSKMAYFASFLYAISPFVWISQITTIVDPVEHVFYFMSFYFFLLAFENKKEYLWAILAGFSIGLSAFAHTQVAMWSLSLILIPIVKHWRPDKVFLVKALRNLVLFTVFAAVWIGAYLYLMKISPTFQPGVSQALSWKENLRYLLIGNIADKQSFSVANLYFFLRVLSSSLVLIFALLGFVELSIKKPKDSLILIILGAPMIVASTYIYENLYGRSLIIGLVAVFVYAAFFILSRKSWLRNILILLVVGQLLIVSLPNILKYHRLAARNEDLSAEQKEVEPGGVFVGTNVNKTWSSYEGTFVPLGDVGYGAGYAKDKIKQSLADNKKGYLSALAIKWPYRRFDGINYDIRSTKLNTDADRGSILSELFNEYSINLLGNHADDRDLALYEVSRKSEIDFNSLNEAAKTGPIMFGSIAGDKSYKNVSVNVYGSSICQENANDLVANDLIYCIKNYLAGKRNLENWTFSDKRGFFALPVSGKENYLTLGIMPTSTNDGEPISEFLQKDVQKISGQFVRSFDAMSDLEKELEDFKGPFYVATKQASGKTVFDLYKFKFKLGYIKRLEAEDLSGQIGDVVNVQNASGKEVKQNVKNGTDAYLISGPYIKLKSGRYHLSAMVKSLGKNNGEVIFDATGDYGRNHLGFAKKQESQLKAGFTQISFDFETDQDVDSTEFRLLVPKGSRLQVDYLELESID